jgi:integrase
MARTLKDAKLDTRAARQRLKQKREPHWRSLSEGLAVGYRKGAKGGTWIGRHYSQEHGRRYQSLGTADDVVDADGVHVLNWEQAQEKFREWIAGLAKQDTGELPAGPYTVKNAVEDYLTWLEKSRKDASDSRYKAEARILPALAHLECNAQDATAGERLTEDRIEKWLSDLADAPALVRSKNGAKERNTRPLDKNDPEAVRARKASANRIWTILRAALNRAWRKRKIASNAEWIRVTAFGDVDGVRLDYLSLAEAGRLLNACDPEFRPIVQAGLLTGARYGAITKLVVTDFASDAGTVRLQTRKGRGKVKIYHCHLTAEGVAFFKAAVVGRNDPNGPIFRKADNGLWGASHQNRPMAEAVEHAKIGRPITFHHLRHTWASHAVMNGTPLLVVAQNLGHADTRMVEKVYGHLAPGYRKTEIEKGAPVFGIRLETNVSSLDGRRTSA